MSLDLKFALDLKIQDGKQFSLVWQTFSKRKGKFYKEKMWKLGMKFPEFNFCVNRCNFTVPTMTRITNLGAVVKLGFDKI